MKSTLHTKPLTMVNLLNTTNWMQQATAILALAFMLIAGTTNATTCYNVNDGGYIGQDQTVCSGTSVTITNEELPTGGSGILEYLWLSNVYGPYTSDASTSFTTNPSFTTGPLTETVWVRRCSRRSGCSSWDYGESNWIKITVGNAAFQHVDVVDETACDANNGKIITDPYVDVGTVLPYTVSYTYNGQMYTTNPYYDNKDNYITGLAPGVYSDLTLTDANGCTDNYGSVTIHEYTSGCNPSSSGTITSIVLTNGSESITLQDGGSYQICDLPINNYLDALVSGTHESFKFKVDGHYRTENVIPYNFPAVTNGETWNPGIGAHSIKGYLFSQNGATGNLLDEIQININIIACGSSVGDFVFNDLNGNGIQESGEFGLQGISVMLLNENGSVVDQTTSDQEGKYEFTGVASGNYKIKFPEGGTASSLTYNLTQANVGSDETKDSDAVASNNGSGDALTDLFTVIAGDDITDLDAGYFIGSKITGVSWNDLNNNGIQDADEPRLENITVTLLDENGNIVDQVATNQDGVYTFDNLAPGDYKVNFSDAITLSGLNYELTIANQGTNENNDSDAVPTNDGSGDAMTQLVSIQNGQTIDNLDAGYFAPAKIGDKIFNDLNGNGIQDSDEFGIQGILVMLLDANGNVIDQTTSNQDGNYQFTGLVAGDYSIKFPEGGTASSLTYNLTQANVGSDETKDSDAVASNDGSGDALTDLITVNEGDDITDIDAGYFIGSKITGLTWNDLNNNGIQDANEPRLENITATLLDENGNTLDQVTTDQDGIYTFDNLAPGNYKVNFSDALILSGLDYELTIANQGTNENNDSDAVPTNDGSGDAMTQLVSVQNGQTIDNLGTGYFAPAKVGDFVFNDLNGNGIQDSGEPGISKILVILLDENGNQVDQTTTNQDGFYQFTRVTAGNFKLRFPVSESENSLTYNLTEANLGGDENLDSDPIQINGSNNAETPLFTVNPGDNITNQDAGYYIGSKLTGVAFGDTNANGIQEFGDPRLEGITVYLADANGSTLDETTTNDLGVYDFENLAPGDYKIIVAEIVTDINGGSFVLTFANEGTDNSKDSDLVLMDDDSGNAMSEIVSLQNGQTVDNLDAGFIELAKLGNRIFEDVNENGLFDGVDLPVEGATVNLLGTDIFGKSVETSQATDAEGLYSFDQIVPGSYFLEISSNDPTLIPTYKDVDENGSDNNDSDINSSGITDEIEIGAGEEISTIFAGFMAAVNLPVELISFEAVLINQDQVTLRWSTASEENNKHFIIERSIDGEEFEAIGIVSGNGTTNLNSDYIYNDFEPYYGHNYYRLKQFDFDGQYDYSHVETVVISGGDLPELIMYPNPVQTRTTLRVVEPFEADTNLEIIDTRGVVVKRILMEKGVYSKQIDLSGFPSGMYFAYINFNGHRTLVYNIMKVEE